MSFLSLYFRGLFFVFNPQTCFKVGKNSHRCEKLTVKLKSTFVKKSNVKVENYQR